MKNKKAAIIPAIMAAANSLAMGFVMCVINVGFGSHFGPALLQSFLIGLAVTTPVSYFLPVFLNKVMK